MKFTGSFFVITTLRFSLFVKLLDGTNGFLRIASISSRCSLATRAISLVSGSTE
jgi:hypothetical protein